MPVFLLMFYIGYYTSLRMQNAILNTYLQENGKKLHSCRLAALSVAFVAVELEESWMLNSLKVLPFKAYRTFSTKLHAR